MTLATPTVPLRDALRVWVRVAALSFGGPAGQIAVMHRILVEEKRWVSEERFLHALNYCMLLPGPEAQQLATYIGWLLHRTLGGLIAGLLFVLPGFVSILVLSILYAEYADLAWVAALFFGLKPAVMAIVVQAILRIGKRALRSRTKVGIATAAFAALFFFEVPYPLVVLVAALAGLVGRRIAPTEFAALPSHGAQATHTVPEPAVASRRPLLRRTLGTVALWSFIWIAPIVALAAWLGREHVLCEEAVFFSKTAVVTFGGAYSVLAYIAQQAVENFGWLAPGEMLDGLGMAETTPGPLIQVVQFVGFMGAYRDPGGFEPMTAAILGSVVATWVTFAPCFLWIFAGAPYIEHLRGRANVDAALSAITAAVVGVIANLAVWFALHTVFGVVAEEHHFGARFLVPDLATLDLAAAVIAVAAGVALLRFRVGMFATLAGSVVVGAAWYLLR